MTARQLGAVVLVAMPVLCVAAGIATAYLSAWIADPGADRCPGDWGDDWPFDDDGEPFEEAL